MRTEGNTQSWPRGLPVPADRPAGIARTLWAIAFIGIALFLLGWAARSWLVVTFPFQVEYGEGPVAGWARDVAQGALPYKTIQPPPWTFSVYTPLSLLLGGALHSLGVPLWLGGRLLSLLSALALTVLCFRLALAGGQLDSPAFFHRVSEKRMDLRRVASRQRRDNATQSLSPPRNPSARGTGQGPAFLGALAAAGLFLSSPYLARWATFYRPDLLALFWSALGIALVARVLESRDSRRVSPAVELPGAAIAFVAAFMTKQSYLAGPLAALVALALYSPRHATRLLVVGAAGSILTLGGLAFAVGPRALWESLVTGNANAFSLQSLWMFEASFFRLAAVLIILAAVAAVRRPRSSGDTLLALYALFSLLATVGVGKAGAWENYFLEPFWVLCVLGGRALGRLAATPRPVVASLAPLLVTAQLLLFIPGFERIGPLAEQRWLGELRTEREALLEVVQAVPAGVPVLSEDLGILATAGRAVFLHTFVYTQLAAQGDFDQAPLLQMIADRRFPLVIQRGGALEDRMELDRWTAEMLAATEEAYAIEGSAGEWLLMRPAPTLRPLDLTVNPALRLRGWAVEVNQNEVTTGPISVKPGDIVEIHLLWERAACEGCPEGPEQSYIHVLDAAGQRIAQSDGPPRLGSADLTGDQPAIIRDVHTLTVPAGAPRGALRLEAGAYRLLPDGLEPLGPALPLASARIRSRAQVAEPVVAPPSPDRVLGPLALREISLLPSSLRGGEPVAITATWQAVEWPQHAYSTFLHLVPLGASGPPLAQQDQQGLSLLYPTSVWSAGEEVPVEYHILLPDWLPPATYELRLGWYDPATGRRLGGAAGDSLLAGSLTVAP